MGPLRLIAAPAAAWVVLSALWLVGAAIGVPAGADGRSMTLTEAAAVASHADAARLLDAGADPNAPQHLRAGLVRNDEATMTPLEASTAAIRTGPVQMLVEHGATIDERNYAVLWCGATARNNQDMLRFLQSVRPNQPPVNCAGVRSLW